MPEIAAIFSVGSLLTFLLVNLNLYLVHREFKSMKLYFVNHNLSKVQLFWSNDAKQILKIENDLDRKKMRINDYKKSTRSAFIFGTIMIFLSWFGLIFFFLYFASVHWLAKSREEIKLFSSVLSEREILEKADVSIVLTDLMIIPKTEVR